MNNEILEVVLLADDSCSTTKAYLEYMFNAGIQPSKIIQVTFIGNGRKAKFLTKIFGKKLVAKLISWKNRKQKYTASFKEYCEIVQQGQPIKINYFAKTEYAKYTKDIEAIAAVDLSDKYLIETLKKEKNKVILYTGGGIVPEKLLRLPWIKVLHIHPGIVPFIRGSDGLFWSIAIRGQPGASCFFMNKGIDTGCVVGQKEFEAPRFVIKKEVQNEDEFCESLVFAYDPHLRARLLIDVLKSSRYDPILEQNETLARVFFTMHDSIKKRLMRKMLK